MLAWMREHSEHVSRHFLRYVRPIYETDESANPVPMAMERAGGVVDHFCVEINRLTVS